MPFHMLLVDDDEDVRFLVARMFRRAGHSIRTVPGGREALESLGSDGLPDLVIVDHTLKQGGRG